jgi:hypothetical protein
LSCAAHEAGDPLHDETAAMCGADGRTVLMLLQADEGRCFVCGAAGLVVRPMDRPEATATCPGCVVEMMMSETAAVESADGNWRN